MDYVYIDKAAQAAWLCESVANLGLVNVGSSTSNDPTDHTALCAVFKRNPEKDAQEKEGKDKKKKTNRKQKTKKQKQLSNTVDTINLIQN